MFEEDAPTSLEYAKRKMNNLIVCHLLCYRPYTDRKDEIFRHIADQGLGHLETYVPREGGEPSELVPKLTKYGLKLESVRTSFDLTADSGVDMAGEYIRTISEETPCRRIIPSLKDKDVHRQDAYDRLRRIGDLAAERDVTISLETHPELCGNGDAILSTMQGVDHPNVRSNFDTANIYFYNRGLNTVDELKKVVPFVDSVHLKETSGEFQTHTFPALGEGVVDFKGVFDVLNAHGFHGPLSLELEGVRGRAYTFEDKKRMVERSLAHLRAIGCM